MPELTMCTGVSASSLELWVPGWLHGASAWAGHALPDVQLPPRTPSLPISVLLPHGGSLHFLPRLRAEEEAGAKEGRRTGYQRLIRS